MDLTRHAVAQWLWKRLRRAFPKAIAAVLMSNHIHVLAPAKIHSLGLSLGPDDPGEVVVTLSEGVHECIPPPEVGLDVDQGQVKALESLA